MRSLTEMSSDFRWESDVDHRFTQRASADKTSSTVLVFQQGALIGEQRSDMPYLSPNAAGWAAHRAVLDAHQPFRDFEFSCLGVDGTERYISISGDPVFDGSGAFKGYRGVGTDITERRQAEHAMHEGAWSYRNLFENMLEGFAYCRMLFDNGRPVDFVYIEVNPAFAQLTGLKNVVGKKVSELVPGLRESNPEVFERYGRVASTGKPESFEVHLTPLKMSVSISAFCPRKGYFVALFQDTTERRQAEAALRESAGRLETLSRRLLQVQDEERHRIARELHDRLGQTLAALGIHLELTRGALPARSRERVRPHLGRAQELIELSAAQVRELMAELHPPGLEDYGLFAALRVYKGTLTTLGDTHVELRGKELSPRPPREIEVALFRIAQEALANAAIHAHAQRVEVSLEQSEQAVTMSIADDGVGFDTAGAAPRPNWGLDIMRERAEAVGASLRVDSAPGRGTRVSVEAPWRVP